MADQLNEVVKALSSIHKTANKSYFQFASYACNPKHFPKVVTAMIFSSTVIGFGVMEIVNRRREKHLSSYMIDTTITTNDNNKISEGECLVRAMIENAKSSSTIENLENAVMAFDRTVRHDEERHRKYLQRIGRKMEEMNNEQTN